MWAHRYVVCPGIVCSSAQFFYHFSNFKTNLNPSTHYMHILENSTHYKFRKFRDFSDFPKVPYTIEIVLFHRNIYTTSNSLPAVGVSHISREIKLKYLEFWLISNPYNFWSYHAIVIHCGLKWLEQLKVEEINFNSEILTNLTNSWTSLN